MQTKGVSTKTGCLIMVAAALGFVILGIIGSYVKQSPNYSGSYIPATTATEGTAKDAEFLQESTKRQTTIGILRREVGQRVGFDLTAEEHQYKPGDRLTITVTAADTAEGVLRIAIGSVSLTSPISIPLYSNPKAGDWGDMINLRGGSRKAKDETCDVELTLTSELVQASEQHHPLKFRITYRYAQNTFSGSFENHSGEGDVEVEVKAVENAKNAYLLRVPGTRKAYAVKEATGWTVEIDSIRKERFNGLVWWTPAHSPNGKTILYAGQMGTRFHYVIDYGNGRKTSLNGNGYSGFGFRQPGFWSSVWNGTPVPVFWDSSGKPAFFARKQGGWCLIKDGTEYPPHEDCLALVLFVQGNSQCIYLTKNDAQWDVNVGFESGKETVLCRRVGTPLEVDTFDWELPDDYLKSDRRYERRQVFSSQMGRIAFAARDGTQGSKAIQVFFTDKPLPSDAEEAMPQCTTSGPWHEVNDFWWSPSGKLVFVGDKKSICIDGKVVTPSRAREMFDAEFKGNTFHEAVAKWVERWEKQ